MLINGNDDLLNRLESCFNKSESELADMPEAVYGLGYALSGINMGLDDEDIASSDAKIVFTELWDWYSSSTGDSAWTYYERVEKANFDKALSYLAKHSDKETAAMYSLGAHDYAQYNGDSDDYPEEWFYESEQIDRFINDNELKILLIIRGIVRDNPKEFTDISSGAATDNIKAFEKIADETPEITEFIKKSQNEAQNEAKKNFAALMNSGCMDCGNRLPNNARNELVCKAFPDGVPYEFLMAAVETKSECANGFGYVD